MSKSNGRVTLEDIAKATGFTINTVSRALKNKPDISRQTAERIQQTAREMGYVRNYIASSLRSGRTKTIAMITGTMSNPYYAILADLLQQEAAQLGYGLMILCSKDDAETENQAIEMALSRQVDGILITPVEADSPGMALLRASGKPFVLLSRYLRKEKDDSVIQDDEQGGYLAGKHLIEKGHRKLAFLSYHHVVYSTRTRLEGFMRACREAGIPEENVFSAEISGEEKILSQLREWIRLGVTGVFSFCDVEAWSCITLLEGSGIHVPKDLVFIGFDNILGYLRFPKPICSIDGHLREEAHIAIDLLRNRIHDPDLPPQHVIIPVELVCRNTCG